MEIDFDSGIYLLEIHLKHPETIKIGARGSYDFPVGYYYYCGTAQKNLKSRLERHLSDKKKLHWHIDYLLEEAEIEEYFAWPFSREKECRLAEFLLKKLSGQVIVPGFGASDCHCQTHLLYFPRSVQNRFRTCKEWF